MNRRYIAALLVAALLWTVTNTASAAGQAPGRHGGPFSVHDLDGDGVLSRDEYARLIEHLQAHRRASGRPHWHYTAPLEFETLDMDADGFVNEVEMIEQLRRQHQHRQREQMRRRSRGPAG